MSRTDEDRIKGDILQSLRSNPKGLTITEISSIIGLNRNSTAKYLDILKVNGVIDLRPMGRAKMYYASHRVPISALLNFSTDYILVLDGNMRIIEVNDNLQKLFKIKKEMLLDVPLSSSNLPIFNTKDSIAKIRKAIKGKESTFEMKIGFDKGDHFFKGKLIPSRLGDGTNGVTIIMENISDQKYAERELRISEERYKELIRNQGEGLGITDVNDVFTFANPAAERLLDVEPGGLIGRSLLDFIPVNERKKIILQNERRKRGKKDTYQVKMISESGKKIAILLTATPRYDNEGRFIGSLGVFRDITLMRENQRKTRKSESRFRSLFESSSDGILIMKGREIIECNQSTVRMFGYTSKDEIIGKSPSALSPELQSDGTPSEQAVMNKIRETDLKGFVNFIWDHRTSSGELFLADVRLHKIELEDETLYQATLRDITDVIRTQNEVIDKERKLDNILSSLHGSFIGLLDHDLVFNEFWGTGELDKKYGIEYMKMKGMKLIDFTPAKDIEMIKNGIDRTFVEGKPFRTEVSVNLPNGSFWQDWSFSPFKGKSGDIEYVVQFGRDTHEKNKMIEALMKIGKRYRLLDSNVNDVIWMADMKLNYTYVSSSIKGLLGYESKDILKMSIHDTLSSEDFKNVSDQLRGNFEIMKSGNKDTPRPVTLEIQQLRKDGSRVWCEVVISFLSDEKGQPEGVMGITRNIEERKRAELEIMERESKLENILSSLYGSFIGLIGPDLKYHSFWGSKVMDEEYGINSNMVKGKDILDFAPSGQRDNFKNLVNNIFLTGNPTQIEVESDLPAGKRWQLMSFSPYMDKSSKIRYVVQFGSDTTDKNLAIRSLKEAEKKYKLLDDNASDVIWMTDEELNYTYISSSSRDLTGYEADELIGKSIFGRVESESTENIYDNFRKEIDNYINDGKIKKKSFKLELQLNHRNGNKLWTEVNISVLTDKEQRPTGMMGVTRDITERKKTRDDLITLTSAIRFASEAIIIFDLDGKIKFINDQGRILFGLEASENAEDLTGFDLILPEDKEATEKIIQQVYEEGVIRDINHSILDRKGGRKYLQTSANLLMDSMGSPMGYLTITKDITEARMSLKELERKDRILESISEIATKMLDQGEWKDKIWKTLSALGKAANVSRAYIFKNEIDGEENIITTQIFEWAEDTVESQEDNLDLVKFPFNQGFSRWEEVLGHGDNISGNIEDFPESEKNVLESQGILSLVVVPIFIREKWWGFIGFDDCKEKREWFPEEIRALRMAGSILGVLITGHQIQSSQR